MINLLPPAYKQELRSARTNVILRRYIIFQIIAVIMLAVAVAGTYFIISMTKSQSEDEIATNQAKASSYSAVDASAKEFQTNLSTAKTILDKEVRYTNVILAISRHIPSGVVLDSISLDSATFGQPTSLVAKAKTYDDSLRLKESFEKSGIFDSVRLESVARAGDGQGTGNYPVDIRINVTIRKDIAK